MNLCFYLIKGLDCLCIKYFFYSFEKDYCISFVFCKGVFVIDLFVFYFIKILEKFFWFYFRVLWRVCYVEEVFT